MFFTINEVGMSPKNVGRKVPLIVGCTLLLSCSALKVSARPVQDAFKHGFHGYIQPVIGVSSFKSNVKVGDDNKKIDSLTDKASSETEFVPFVFWELSYTFEGESLQLYAGTPEENFIEGSFLLEAGMRYQFADRTKLTLAWVPNFPIIANEVWEDPFLLGERRNETDRESNAFKVEASSIMGTGLGLRYGYGIQEIDREQSGFYLAGQPGSTLSSEDLKQLERDTDFHLFEVQYLFRLNNGFSIRPSFTYLLGDADGDSNSFDNYEGKLAFVLPVSQWVIFGNVAYAYGDYDKENPIFNTSREDDILSSTLGFLYKEPFGYENWSVTLFGSYRDVNSNISFYDSQSFFTGLGVGWQF